MKEVINEEPIYNYLDTYANLMYKSGNKKETKRIAQLAIEAAKKEGKNTKSMEELINNANQELNIRDIKATASLP